MGTFFTVRIPFSQRIIAPTIGTWVGLLKATLSPKEKRPARVAPASLARGETVSNLLATLNHAEQ